MRSSTALRFLVDGGIVATALIAMGSLWDTLIHITDGHTLLAPAHLLIGASAFFFTISGASALGLLRHADLTLRRHLKIVVWGGATVFVALAVIDELWHIFLGFDTSGWSPPHLLFWLGTLVELCGLVMLERWIAKERQRLSPPSRMRMRQLLVSASILVVLLFLFLEFDVPASDIGDVIPGFVYPVTGTLTFVTGLLIVSRAVGRVLAATASAAIAWFFFWITGAIIQWLSGISFVLPPFPIVIPALVLDGWRLCFWRNEAPGGRKQFMWASLAVSPVCYWAMIGWANHVTRLPQQLSGGFHEWVLWFFMFVPVLSLVSGYVASRVSEHSDWGDADQQDRGTVIVHPAIAHRGGATFPVVAGPPPE